jgi:hypothetical protein
MDTLESQFKHSAAYWGERGEWLVACATTRDADCLGRSNWRCFIKLLNGTGTEGAKGSQEINENVAIEEASHWACGWVQYLIINPAAVELVALAEATREKLEDYPVIDEQDWSELETEEANDVWRDCYRPKERIKYIKEHRGQFEFRGLADLLGCVRGKYFAGYASELLN